MTQGGEKGRRPLKLSDDESECSRNPETDPISRLFSDRASSRSSVRVTEQPDSIFSGTVLVCLCRRSFQAGSECDSGFPSISFRRIYLVSWEIQVDKSGLKIRGKIRKSSFPLF